MRKTIALAAALSMAGLSLSGCYGYGRPGHASDHHHGGHHGGHDGHHDHDRWR